MGHLPSTGAGCNSEHLGLLMVFFGLGDLGLDLDVFLGLGVGLCLGVGLGLGSGVGVGLDLDFSGSGSSSLDDFVTTSMLLSIMFISFIISSVFYYLYYKEIIKSKKDEGKHEGKKNIYLALSGICGILSTIIGIYLIIKLGIYLYNNRYNFNITIEEKNNNSLVKKRKTISLAKKT